MSDTLSEFEGCTHLSRLFRRRGYTIERNVMFREYGVEFHIDGWDKKARVGFEYLTSEDDDHDDLDVEEFQALGDAQLRGELAIFIIDEVEPVSTEALIEEASEFLDEIQSFRPLRKVRPVNTKKKKGTKKKKTSKKKPSKKVARKSGKKLVKKKLSAVRKPAKKKAIKKKTSAKKVAASKTVKKKVKKKTAKKKR